MRSYRLLTAVLSGFALLVLIGILNSQREYEWKATYAHADDEPYGCQLFDSVMAASLDGRYAVEDLTLDSLWADSLRPPCGVLVTTNHQLDDSLHVERLKTLVRRGFRVLLAGHFSPIVVDDYDTLIVYSRFSDYYYTDLQPDPYDLVTYRYTGDAPLYQPCSYTMYDAWCSDTLCLSMLPYCCDVLAWRDTGLSQTPVAVSLRMGKGELVLASTPLLFTNAAILDDTARPYVFRLMSHLGNGRIVRLDPTLHARPVGEASLLGYIWKEPPLRAAFLLTLLGMVLFMGFTARRRQRVIPLQGAPHNHYFDFVRLIGTLYREQGNHADLVAKKYQYVTEQLRRVGYGDARRQTGLRQELDELYREACRQGSLTARQMRYYIDRMNEIQNKI